MCRPTNAPSQSSSGMINWVLLDMEPPRMSRSNNIFGPRIQGNLAKQLSELIDQLHIDQVTPALVLARLLVVLRDAAELSRGRKPPVNARASRSRSGRNK